MAKAGKSVSSSKAQQASNDSLWDRPVLMNMIADALLLFAVVALAYAALLGARHLPIYPLQQLVVTGKLQQVTPMQIEYAARSSIVGNFFTINLDAIRSTFEKLPWVRHARVRRSWPDGIEVSIEEHVAAARWRQADGEYRLINSFGESFAAASEADLPVFSGPEGSEEKMLSRLNEFTQMLAALGRQPKTLELSLRQAWQLRLDDGLVLALGRDETAHPVSERLARFVASYPEAVEKLGFRPGLIDMRYPNGFAARPARDEPVSS